MSTDYTPNAERALEGAVAAARQFNHSYVGTEHILCSILAIPTCEAYRRFERLHIEPEELRLQLESMIGRGEAVRIIGDIPLTARTKKILELAKIEANHLNCEQVGTEHMVLAMLREGESVGAQILYGHNLDPEKFMAASSSSPNVPPPPEDGEDQADEPDDNSEDGVPEESKGKKGKSKTPFFSFHIFMYCELFQIHRNKLKPDPISNCCQASVWNRECPIEYLIERELITESNF